ncbi:hypothetical protein Nepgr_026346 [Nepenthes gracilis]|uniref:Uncharacterized protein n=1 Tax=Nepenthes gracilis TaxID=150966 RepID=A0AAD3T7Y2_NEPGR|nr:hypothetical protein Nepgr_026346 [Nepenthes gracilis]
MHGTLLPSWKGKNTAFTRNLKQELKDNMRKLNVAQQQESKGNNGNNEPIVELEGEELVAELDGEQPVAELEGEELPVGFAVERFLDNGRC